MQLVHGFYLPDADKHFKTQLKDSGGLRGTYQLNRLNAALPLCKNKNVALDIGAHVGIMTWQLLQEFQFVFSYEPNKDNRRCFEKNLADYIGIRVFLKRCALGNIDGGHAELQKENNNSGMSHIKPKTEVSDGGYYDPDKISMERLDSQYWNNEMFPTIDLIKIDVEGYEKFVVQGGIETIKKHYPVMIVEQAHSDRYGQKNTAAVDLLQTFGYQVSKKINDDYIMWKP